MSGSDAPRSGAARTRLRVTHSRVIATRAAVFEGALLLMLGLAGMAMSWNAHPTTQEPLQILGLRVNLLHSGLYVVAGLALLLAAGHVMALRRVVVTETIVFTLLFVFGTAFSANRPTRTMWNLDAPDNVLHGGLAVIGLTLVLLLYARGMTAPIRTGERQ